MSLTPNTSGNWKSFFTLQPWFLLWGSWGVPVNQSDNCWNVLGLEKSVAPTDKEPSWEVFLQILFHHKDVETSPKTAELVYSILLLIESFNLLLFALAGCVISFLEQIHSLDISCTILGVFYGKYIWQFGLQGNESYYYFIVSSGLLVSSTVASLTFAFMLQFRLILMTLTVLTNKLNQVAVWRRPLQFQINLTCQI